MNCKNQGKNNQIQFLRAVFCLFIIFYHFTVRYAELYSVDNLFNNNFFALFSHIGITSFFIISGYYLIRRGSDCRTAGRVIYWFKRFLNIYLPYFVAVILIYLFSLTGLFGATRTVSFPGFVQNLFFINQLTGAPMVDGAHWYVFALLCLYFVAFVYDLLFRKNDEYGFMFWVLLLVVSVTSLLIEKNIDCGSFLNRAFKFFNFFLCRGYFPYVFIGIFFYYLDYDKIKCRKNCILIGAVLLSLFYVVFDDWVYLILALCSSTLIMLALFRKLSCLEKIKPFVLLGNASYSVYLLHQNIGYMLLNLFTKAISYYLALVFVIAIAIMLGVAFFVFVEKNIKKITTVCFDRQKETH